MKNKARLLTLAVASSLSFGTDAFGYARWHITNVGTNAASLNIWYDVNGDPGSNGGFQVAGDGNLAPGATWNFQDGRTGNLVVNCRYGIAGGARPFNVVVGAGNFDGPAYQDIYANVTAQGPPTNCQYAITIVNPDLIDHLYAYRLSSCSSFISNIIVIPAGGTNRITWTDPCCGGGGYSYYMAGYTGAPPSSDNPFGTGGNSGLAAGIAPSATAPPQTAPPPPVTPPPYIPPPNPGPGGPGGPPNLGGPNTNGPINYGTNALNNPTNSVDNSVVMQGDSAVYTAVSVGDANIVNAIKQADNNNVAATASNNAWLGQIATNGTGLSNLLAQIGSNTIGENSNLGGILTNTYNTSSTLSNIYGQMTNAVNALPTNFDTNLAINAGNLARTGWSGVTNSITAPLDTAPTSAGSMVLSVGAINIDCNPLHISAIHDLAIWVRIVVTFGFALASVRSVWSAMERYIAEMGSVRQASTAGQSVLGTNTNYPSAQAMALVITIALGTLPAIFLTWPTLGIHAANITGGIFHGIASLPLQSAIALMDAFMPLDYMVASTIDVLVTRMVLALIWAVATTISRHATGT